MKLFLCGAFLPVVVFALASFTPEQLAATTPVKLADLTLDRVVRQVIDLSSGSVTVTAPPTFGIVITSLSGVGGVNIPLTASINGGTPQNFAAQVAVSGLGACSLATQAVDPPLIIKPGDTVVFAASPIICPPNPTVLLCLPPAQATLGGYLVYPGEV